MVDTPKPSSRACPNLSEPYKHAHPNSAIRRCFTSFRYIFSSQAHSGQSKAMDPNSLPVQPAPEMGSASFSCLTCRHRKVKCDRRTPTCSNCSKSGRECSFVSPVRGKRKRTKTTEESLPARLQRYEEMLKSYGAKIEASEAGEDSDLDAVSETNTEQPPVTERTSGSKQRTTGSKIIVKDGTSRYFER